MKQTLGYIRVSSKDQNEDRQVIALAPFQIPKRNLYMDKLSGKDFNRPAYQRMLKRLQRDDLIIVKSIDRLGRNYDEIIEQWRIITKEKGANIMVVDMPLLSYVAQTERENIRQRQAEGISAAQARGICFGRPCLEIPENYEKCYARWKSGDASSRMLAKELGVSQGTFLKWSKLRAIR